LQDFPLIKMTRWLFEVAKFVLSTGSILLRPRPAAEWSSPVALVSTMCIVAVEHTQHSTGPERPAKLPSLAREFKIHLVWLRVV
jgi:hypothetical protein